MNAASRGMNRAVLWVLAAIMTFQTATIFAAVVSRYVFNYSFPWIDEVARGLLTWLIFLGATAAYRHGELVDIPFIKDALPRPAKRLLYGATAILILIFLGYTIYYGIALLSRTSRQITPVLGIKLNYFMGAVVVGSCIMAFHVLSDFIDLLRGKEIASKNYLEDLAS